MYRHINLDQPPALAEEGMCSTECHSIVSFISNFVCVCAGMTVTKDHSLVKLTTSSFCNVTKQRPSLTELHQLINSVQSEQPCSRAVLRPLVRCVYTHILTYLLTYLHILSVNVASGRTIFECRTFSTHVRASKIMRTFSSVI